MCFFTQQFFIFPPPSPSNARPSICRARPSAGMVLAPSRIRFAASLFESLRPGSSCCHRTPAITP